MAFKDRQKGREAGYKIGIYVRESRDDNEENYETIETQRDLLLDYVYRNSLGEVIRVYMDDNMSGSGFSRPGLELLKEDVVSGEINLLLLKDLSRLGRNNAKTLMFLDFLEEYGVRVITFDGKYDSAKDNDTVGIETWFNERYIRDVSRKIRASLRFKIEKGEYIGHAPYGYIKSEESKNKLCIDENTAPVVREIYRLYRAGYGYLAIARLLNSKGCPPPSVRGGPGNGVNLWNAVAVKRILCSRVYTGDTVQGVSEKVSFKSKKTRKLPRDLWVVTENTHEAIIGREEFEEVQRIRAAKMPGSGAHKGTLHLFKGLLYCGGCGSPMFARKRKNRPMGYICGRYAKGGKISCASHYVDEKFIEGILLKDLLDMFEDTSLKAGLKKMLDADNEENGMGRNEIPRLRQLLLNRQRQQETLYMDRLENKISEQLFLRANKNLESSIAKIMQEIQKAEGEKNRPADAEELIQKALLNLKNSGITHEIVRRMVDRITVYDPQDEADISYTGSVGGGGIKGKGAVLIDYRFSTV
jgi:DNA invertase Pin-like site-specific DNA recombinase